MNDSEYAARWRRLIAQLRELERSAGVADSADRARGAATPASGRTSGDEQDEVGDGVRPDPYSFLRGSAQRREIRALYFGVAHEPLRKALINKHRELVLFERTGLRTHLDDARRDLEALRRRPSEGWWIAAIVGATLVVIGYELFAVFGAIAGGVAALFVGNGIEQGARRRFEHAIAAADEDSRAAAAAVALSEQTPEWFNEREASTGHPDAALDASSESGEIKAKFH